MEFPSHFFHPFIVHAPVLFPLIIFLLCLLRWRDLSSFRTELWIILALQSVFTVMAFYSGSWVSDTIIERVQPSVREAIEWHYLWGRIVLIGSLVTGAVVVVATIATRHERCFALLAVFLSFSLSVLSLVAGASGGELVHDHGINFLFLEQPVFLEQHSGE
jgi:hypothetical protein